jgi:hypothetical protein
MTFEMFDRSGMDMASGPDSTGYGVFENGTFRQATDAEIVALNYPCECLSCLDDRRIYPCLLED